MQSLKKIHAWAHASTPLTLFMYEQSIEKGTIFQQKCCYLLGLFLFFVFLKKTRSEMYLLHEKASNLLKKQLIMSTPVRSAI